jgi:hypothetical protein
MLQVNCPACRGPVRIGDDSPTSEWECPECLAAFRVRTSSDGMLQGTLVSDGSAIQTSAPSRRRRRLEPAEAPYPRREATGIVGFDELSDEEVNQELANGAKFVIYSYCISILILTFKQPSAIHFVRSDESRFLKGIPYTMISLVAGWWGIPFGIIYTIWCIVANSAGGTDVTAEILGNVRQNYEQ